MRKSTRAPRVSSSTTYFQKWKLASTSIAWCCSPSRLESIAVPARSRLVKIRPTSPRWTRLWLVWSASVLLPESMVPVKNCSSATGATLCRTGRSGVQARSLHRLVDTVPRAEDRDPDEVEVVAAYGADGSPVGLVVPGREHL